MPKVPVSLKQDAASHALEIEARIGNVSKLLKPDVEITLNVEPGGRDLHLAIPQTNPSGDVSFTIEMKNATRQQKSIIDDTGYPGYRRRFQVTVT